MKWNSLEYPHDLIFEHKYASSQPPSNEKERTSLSVKTSEKY